MNLKSKSIRLRLVQESDASFILALRLNDRLNQFLSEVSPDLAAQQQWIRSYKELEHAKKEFYFIIERLDGVACGTVRVYDLTEDSFCWGSWILNDDKTKFAALESAFLVYEFGFSVLGYSKSHFEVMKSNERVVSFHRKMGATLIKEDAVNYYFNIDRDAISDKKQQLIGKLL